MDPDQHEEHLGHQVHTPSVELKWTHSPH
jgi:hypothetical protein